MATKTIARHARPPCGHQKLVECPLSVDDWNVVFLAYLGFLQTCRLVSEQAHARHNATRGVREEA